MDGVKKKINFDPALLYYSNKTDEEETTAIPAGNVETYNRSNRKHSCNICGKRFFTISSLNGHIEHHSSDEQKSIHNEEDILKHRSTLKKGNQFACDKSECNFIALDAVESQKHLTVCKGKRLTVENAPAFCEKCEHYFTTANHLKAHTVLIHSEGCSDISLDKCRIKHIISDPVCLYISENNDGENCSNKNRTMYSGPESSSSKKKSKDLEPDNTSQQLFKKTSVQDDCQKSDTTLEIDTCNSSTKMNCGSHENITNGGLKHDENHVMSVEEVTSCDNNALKNMNESSTFVKEIIVSQNDNQVLESSNNRSTINDAANGIDVNRKEVTVNNPVKSEAITRQTETPLNSEIADNNKSDIDNRTNSDSPIIEILSNLSDGKDTLSNRTVESTKTSRTPKKHRKPSSKKEAPSPTGDNIPSNPKKSSDSPETLTNSEKPKSPKNELKNPIDNRECPAMSSAKQSITKSVIEPQVNIPENSSNATATANNPTKKSANNAGTSEKLTTTSSAIEKMTDKLESSRTSEKPATSNSLAKKAADKAAIPVKPTNADGSATKPNDVAEVSLPQEPVNNPENPTSPAKLTTTKPNPTSSPGKKNVTPKKRSPADSASSTVPTVANISTSFTDNTQPQKKKRNRKKFLNMSLDSNLNERSVRSRKKLILPDFEYGFDGKFESDEMSKGEMGSGAIISRKRGRPKKGDFLSTVPVLKPATDLRRSLGIVPSTATANVKTASEIRRNVVVTSSAITPTLKQATEIKESARVVSSTASPVAKAVTGIKKSADVLPSTATPSLKPVTEIKKSTGIVSATAAATSKSVIEIKKSTGIVSATAAATSKSIIEIKKGTGVAQIAAPWKSATEKKTNTVVPSAAIPTSKPVITEMKKSAGVAQITAPSKSATEKKTSGIVPSTRTPAVKAVTDIKNGVRVDQPTAPPKSATDVKKSTGIVQTGVSLKPILDNKKGIKAAPASTPLKSEGVASEETEIFSLTTMMSESENDISVNSKSRETLKSDADESWLNKLDFSDGQSIVDSWAEQPRKKGRPCKKKKKAIVNKSTSPVSQKTVESKESDQQQTDKRKRGRPKKSLTSPKDSKSALDTNVEKATPTTRNISKQFTVTEKTEKTEGSTVETVVEHTGQDGNKTPQTKDVPAVNRGISDKTPQTELISKTPKVDVLPKPSQLREVLSTPMQKVHNQTSINIEDPSSVATAKKRGRPKKKKSTTPQTPTSSCGTSTTIVGDEKLSSNEEMDSPSKNVEEKRKRGRPRKSIESVPEKVKTTSSSENTILTSRKLETPEVTAEDEEESEKSIEPPKSDELTADEKQMKKKREFMEYIRIKEEVEDSDLEASGKKTDGSTISPSRKRGRPRSEELAKKRAAAAELSKTKNDRPYSIYNKYNAVSERLLKRRLDPLCTKKTKKRKLLDDDRRVENEDSTMENYEESETSMENGDEGKSGASTSTENDLPYVIKRAGPGRPKVLNKTKRKKKIKISSSSVADTSSGGGDETKNINPELYLADIRNRAKNMRVFKKIREVPKHDEYFPDSLVTCGRCKNLMTLRHYYLNHQASHYFLCWLDGDKELDFTMDTELVRIMQQYVNQEAIRKKLIKLHCEQCHKVMKSVVGYVSHIRFCSKMNEEEFLGTCVLCGKRLKPCSLRHHYVKSHNIPLPNVNAKTKEELFQSVPQAPLKIDVIASTPPSSVKKTSKNFLNFQRKGVDKSDIINDEKFWSSLKTSYDLYMCMGLSCKYMTLSKDDLKNHILNCHAMFCEFKCILCPYKTKYESEIIYHTKNSCKDFSDAEEKGEEDDAASRRRVSNRVKKRKYHYDDELFDDGERKRKKEDDDFRPSEGEDDEHEFIFESDSDDVVEVKSRSNRRKSGHSSIQNTSDGLRAAFLNHSSTRQYDPLTWTVETRLKIFNATPILEELKTSTNEWVMSQFSNHPLYTPKQVKSMKVSFDNETFIEYDLFQSNIVKGVPVSYVGGPVWALAWAPLPAHVSEQYLAVAGLQHMNHLLELNSSVEFPSLIQIWKYSSLDNISNTIDTPTLDLAIAHKYGAVSCMEWCPSGGFDNRMNPIRLGILAVATSAGCVIVYSIPKLDSSRESKNVLAKAEPDLILKVTCDNVQCTRVVWLRRKDQSVICGGFSNGTVALWNISNQSSLLRNENQVYPYRTFEAHNASIIALDAHWLDNGRYLLTSSIDRVMKYWDLEDLSGPLNEQEGSSPIMNVAWLQQWTVSAVGYDCSNLLDSSTALANSRDIVERRKNIANLRDTCWSVAYSDWNDTIALSLCSGQVSVFAAKHMSVLTFKQPHFEKVVTETSLLPLNDDDKDAQEKGAVEERTGLPETKTSFDCTSVLQEFGLRFCDRVKNKTISTKSGFTPDCCNVMSVNKVCWNQNFNSFNWLAVGYESGFVRVFRVERFDKLHLTKFYKMNETSNITLI